MLRPAVNRHVELYQSMGFKYRVQSYALRSFADFAERTSEEFVRADSVLEWAASALSIRQRHDRLRTVHRLACALNAEDQRHEVPPAAVFGGEPRRPRSCHIFTQDEIERLSLAASDADDIGGLKVFCVQRFDRLVTEHRLAELRRCGARQHEHPPRCNHRDRFELMEQLAQLPRDLVFFTQITMGSGGP